jgi:hypothetical protein
VLTLSGALLLGGFVVNAIQRMIFHPTGEEDNHEAIFTQYATSDAWVATHLAEFLLVLVAIAGLLVLCRALRPETPYLALLAASAIIASGAAWAALSASKSGWSALTSGCRGDGFRGVYGHDAASQSPLIVFGADGGRG